MVFVRNPRKTVYFDSVAYSYAGDQLSCFTNHILGNQVVEVSGCDTVRGDGQGRDLGNSLGLDEAGNTDDSIALSYASNKLCTCDHLHERQWRFG